MQIRTAIISMTVWLAAMSCSASNPDSEVGQFTNSGLRTELLAMAEADQALREDLSPERMQDTTFLIEMLTSQERNTSRLREILREHDWPGSDLVGSDGANAAWLLVQHSDADLQERALRLMRQSPNSGVSATDIAMMTDRILVERGRPQLYGTQFQFIDGNLVQDPVDNPDSVDVRRAEVGLPTMAEYVRMLEEAYGVSR